MYSPNVLVYSSRASFFQKFLGLEIQDKFDFNYVSEIKDVLGEVYEQVPQLIFAHIDPENDRELAVFKKIKTDRVLEFIPVILFLDSTTSLDLDFEVNTVLDSEAPIGVVNKTVRENLIHSRHQLDANPFTGLPGLRTTLEQIDHALDNGWKFSICSIELKNKDIFLAQYPNQEEKLNFKKLPDIIKKCIKETVSGDPFFGHYREGAYAVLPPIEKTESFAKKLVEMFDIEIEKYYKLLKATKGDEIDNDKAKLSISVAATTNLKIHYDNYQSVVKSTYHLHRYMRRSSDSVYLVDTRTDHKQDVQESLGDKKPIEKSITTASKKAREDLMHILQNKTVESHFQPIVDCWELDIHAYELLSRFRGKDSDVIIPPLNIFYAARDANLVVPLDIICLEAALERAKTISHQAKIFINVNRETFIEKDTLIDTIKKSNFPAERLVIELTEQSLIRERKQVERVCVQLKQFGIGVALDDAGLGGVSFREAAELKPDYIKFDRALIHGITYSPLKKRHVLSMRAFAKGIGSFTIAEGVEMPSELIYLKKIRLNYVQGFFIARPAKDPPTKIVKNISTL